MTIQNIYSQLHNYIYMYESKYLRYRFSMKKSFLKNLKYTEIVKQSSKHSLHDLLQDPIVSNVATLGRELEM